MSSITLNHNHTLAEGGIPRAIHAVLATDRSIIQTILRVALGVVMLPHGLQKTFGWFGGYGFDGTMGYMTGSGIPALLAFLAIAAESVGAAALIAGVTARVAAFGVGTVMLVATFMHRANGFFMNWSGQQQGEGFEYHILAIALAVAVMIGGAGRWSLDRLFAKKN